MHGQTGDPDASNRLATALHEGCQVLGLARDPVRARALWCHVACFASGESQVAAARLGLQGERTKPNPQPEEYRA